ncbi:MAG: hypothetical protein NTX12_04350, partial [Actinobacteria bacterium]|nr:hypothetical protein [Actinomycetota bacterium]
GPQGATGATGAKGDTGVQGPAGTSGAVGPQGPAGNAGTAMAICVDNNKQVWWGTCASLNSESNRNWTTYQVRIG